MCWGVKDVLASGGAKKRELRGIEAPPHGDTFEPSLSPPEPLTPAAVAPVMSALSSPRSLLTVLEGEGAADPVGRILRFLESGDEIAAEGAD